MTWESYLRLLLITGFADYNFNGAFHWFAWVIFNFSIGVIVFWNFRYVIFKWILAIDDRGISCEIALIWKSLDFTDDQSTFVQEGAWCRHGYHFLYKHVTVAVIKINICTVINGHWISDGISFCSVFNVPPLSFNNHFMCVHSLC